MSLNPQLIGSLPKAILETTPAGAPPPGVEPNFTHPPTRVPVIVAAGTVFLGLAIICFSIRIYTKLVISKKWQWDDLTCSLGFAFSIAYWATVVNGSVNGATGKHLYDLYIIKALNKATLDQDYVTVITATPALGLIKSSLFLQYYALFRPLRWVRISVWLGAIVSGIFYVAVTITAFVLNSPWPGQSLLDDILSWHYQKFAQFSIPTGVIGLLVDWYLLILPIPAVMTLQMSMAKKLGILIIFATGGLAAVASIVTLVYRVRLQENASDATWDVSYVLLWGEIEMFAGVTASSMPTVSKFFTHQNFSLLSSLRSNIAHLLSSSKREKLSDDNAGSAGWNKSKKQTPQENRGYPLKNIDSDDIERKGGFKVQDSQINCNLTREISIA